MRTPRTPPANHLDHLAAEATRLAEDARTLEQGVTTAVDRIAAIPARQAALQLEDLAEDLAEHLTERR